MAILCKDAASNLTQSNSDLVVVCPLFQNTDVIIKRNDKIKSIAIQENKMFHEEYLRAKFEKTIEIHQTGRNALGYAYESGQVDAVFLDVAKSGTLYGEVDYPILNDTFVLVADKNYIGTKEYKNFVKAYNKAVNILNEDSLEMQRQIANYTNLKEERIKDWKVKLLTIK